MANNFIWVNATTLNGTLWDNGTLSSATPITQIGTLTIGGNTKKYLDAQLNNTGNITTNAGVSGVVYFQDGAILNNSGNFELQSGAFGNVISAVGTFNNSGTLKKTTTGDGGIGVTFNNTGTVNVESGILTLAGGVSNGGIFNIASGKTLKIRGKSGYTLGNGSKINGNGNLTLVGLFDLKLSEGADIASTVQLTIDSLHYPELYGFQVDQDWTLPTITKWNGGTFKSTGILTNKGSLTIGGGRRKYLDAQLNNTGNITTNAYVDTGVVYFEDGVILNNSGNFELQSGAFSKVESSAVGTFNNSGTLRKTTSGDGGIYVTFNNTGTVNVESGILTLAGGVSDGGIFNITSGKTLKFGGSYGYTSGYTLGNGSKINGNGNLILESSHRLFDLKLSEGSAIASTVKFTIDSTQYTIHLGEPDKVAGFQVDQDWTLPTITNWNGGTLKSPGVLTNSGSLTIGGGKKKYLDAKLNNTGNIVGNFLNEILPRSYNLIFQVGSVLNNSGNFKLQSGTIGFLDGAIFNNYGNFELHEVGILNVATGSDIAEGTFNNFGTFKKTTIIAGGFGYTNVNFNNKGTVSVEAGTLRLYGGVSDGGIFNINSGKTLIFNSIYTLSNGSKINGDGNLIVDNGIVKLKASEGATIANTVKLTLDTLSGGFHVDGDWTLPTTTNWRTGTFKSTGILTNSGNLNLTDRGRRYLDAQLNNTGNIFHDGGSLELLDGAILNNSGNYEVKALSGYSSGVGGGTFNNSGTYTKTLPGENFIGDFNNTGTVEVRSGTISSGIYTHNNAKLILSGGNFIFNRGLTINGGSIEGNGSIDVKNIGMTNSGLLNPRLAGNTEFGRLTINSSYTETNSASINIQLGGNIAGTNFDQVDINGTATFDGKLNVSLLNNFTPTLGSTFDVLTYDSLNSSSNLDFTGLSINSTLQFLPQWSSNKLTLKVVDKSAPILAIAPANAVQTEGNSGTKPFTFTVTRSGNTTGTNTVNWTVAGTGTNPANATDFGGTLPLGTLTFAANETSKVITVNVNGDITQESNETFTVTLSNASNGANMTTTTATATIQNDDFIGNSSNNTLIGTAGNDYINGGAGRDTLTGGTGSDTFVFQFGQSPVSGADRITDFAIGTDKIDLLTASGGVLAAPTSFTRAANSTATTLINMANSVFTDANGALTGNQALGVNSAALVSVTTSGIAGTYLVINDGVAGFQSSNDLLVNITEYSGTLPALGTIGVSSFFI
jgi:hypothetical protein